MAQQFDQPVIFEQGVEGMGRAFKGKLSEQAKGKLRGIGLDFDKKLQSAYPLAIWEDAVQIVGADQYPNETVDNQCRLAGKQIVAGYSQTTLGGAVVAIGKLIGPKRFLARMGRNWRSASNYLDVDSEIVSEKEVVLKTRMSSGFVQKWGGKPSALFSYRAGVLDGVMEVLNVRPYEVTFLKGDPATQQATYRVKW